MSKKILICDPVAKEAVEVLEEAGLEVDQKFDMSGEDLLGEISQYNGLMVRSSTEIEKPAIDAAAKLEVIGRPGIGLDNIDVDYAEENDIKVYNTPEATTLSVAELTFTHILAAFRDIVAGTNSLSEGKWIKSDLKGREISGKALGIVGYGNIGRAVATRADAFGMEIMAYDVLEIENPEPATMVDMDTLLDENDVVTVHVPLLEPTYHLLGEEEFDRMKSGAVLVDCSRGGVVDENALYDALKKGKIRFASKDVFEEEPPDENPLFDLDNFHATPHIGGQTYEGQVRAGIQAAEKLVEELR